MKESIRSALLKEQGSLCAYCMQRIEAGTMKIEHWHSQSQHPAEQLDYANLLGCCLGNEGESPRNQHCDTRKGERELSLNPADSAHHPRLAIRYDGSGTIRSDDARFDREVNEILNLNWHRLRRNRSAIIDAVIARLSQGHGSRTKAEIKRLLANWQQPNSDGHLLEYCDVAVYYLQKRLART